MEKIILYILTAIFMTTSIGVAGEFWKVYSQVNPVLSLGESSAFDSAHTFDCSVLKYKEQYHMWYRGDREESGTNDQIGYATSINGTDWIRQNNGNSVISFPNENGDAQQPRVVVNKTGEFRIYYRQEFHSSDTLWTAISTDGINWQGNKQIMSDITTFDSLAPLYYDSKYHLWYQNQRIYYTVSDDGENFSTPVTVDIEAGGTDTWENELLDLSCVIRTSEYFKMYYMGNFRCNDSDRCFSAIGMATSSDGITWSKSLENPVFYNGTMGLSDSSALLPWVLIDDDYNKLYYSTITIGNDSSDFNNLRLGMAREKISDINDDNIFDLKDIIYGLQILIGGR